MTEPNEELIDVAPALKQRLLWDLMPHEAVPLMWEVMDLVPPAEDQREEAHQDSHRRLEKTAPLEAIGAVYTVLTADILSRAMLASLVASGAKEIPDDALANVFASNVEVISASLFATLASWLESGVLSYGPALIEKGLV